MPVEIWIPIVICTIIFSLVCLCMVWAFYWGDIWRDMTRKNHLKRQSSIPEYYERCLTCGHPRGSSGCKICMKAQTIVNLEDLRIVTEKNRVPTDDECLVRSINYKQGIGSSWDNPFWHPEPEEQKIYKSYDTYNEETKQIERHELPRHMTREQIAVSQGEVYRELKQLQKRLSE